MGKTKGIYQKLVGVINEIKNPVNSVENPYFGSKYVPLADILDTVKPILRKHGLALIQVPEIFYQINGRQEIGVVKITNRLISDDGEVMDFPSVTFKAGNNSPQAIGSAITYARRYSLSALLGIAGKEEDDDGNLSSQQSYQYQHQGYQQQQIQFINQDQIEELNILAENIANIGGVETEVILKTIGIPLEEIPQNQFTQVKSSFESMLKRAKDKAEKERKNNGDQTESEEKENDSSVFTIKKVEKGTSPSGVNFAKVTVHERNTILMARNEDILMKLNQVEAGDAINISTTEENGFVFISNIHSVSKAS